MDVLPRASQHVDTNIIEQVGQQVSNEEDEIDIYYKSHPETFKGEKEYVKSLQKGMEEAGPSAITLPTRVMAPDVDQTIKFVGTIMKAIDTITEKNSDPILLLVKAEDILNQILTNLNIVCRNDPFFDVISNVSAKHCNAMVKRTTSPTSSRTMNALFADDAFDYYGAEQNEIVEEADEGYLIADTEEREKIINVCQIGVYLAMCNLIFDIKLKNKKVAHETKKKFDEKMKSLSKYTDAWNGAVDLIKGVEHMEQFKRRLDEMNMDNLKVVIKNVLEKPKMKKKKNLN
uniref:Uncharacterized protein n=1 Tax=Meloidogyne javanica TaxID=6303 RepID=A0A915LUG7_MELJA